MEQADEKVREDFTEEVTFGLGFEVWVGIVSSGKKKGYVKQQEEHMQWSETNMAGPGLCTLYVLEGVQGEWEA